MKPVYHFVSHAHWDREWYKPFETFRLDLVDMINTLLEIFDEVPGYKHFTLDGQTIVLEDYREIMPEAMPRLRKLVQAGKVLIGPWYVLPDEFLVSGESTVRNLLFGRRAGEPFGPVMQVGYIPDSFGHIAMMPAILRGFGMDAAIIFRGFGGEPGQERSEYRWQAPDGSEVLMCHLPPNGYGDAYIGSSDPAAFVRKARELQAILDPRATTRHRLCLNGGDHHFPEPYLPEALEQMSAVCEGEFIHSTIPAYVEAVQREIDAAAKPLETVRGELRFGFRHAFAVQSGVYSSRMYLKQTNYACENRLVRYAEPLACWATLAGRPHLQAMLRRGWQLLLQNHPHDSICGCSIDAVHDEMVVRFGKCRQVAEAVIEKSFSALYPDGWDGPESILVFNPQPRSCSRPASASVEFYRQNVIVGLNPNVRPEPLRPEVSGIKIVDAHGAEIPYQVLARTPDAHALRFSHYAYPSKRLVEKFDLLVDLQDLPGLGFAAYRVQPAAHFPRYRTALQCGPHFLENDALRLEVLENGSINLHDKRQSADFSGLHIFEDGGDAGDEYNYSYPLQDKIVTSESARAQIELVEAGPLRATLQVQVTLDVPAHIEPDFAARSRQTTRLHFTTRYRLYHNLSFVECETQINNTARDHRLRVLFPTGFATRESLADSQFCRTRRTHRHYRPENFAIEVPSCVHPMQRAATLTDGRRAFSIATAGLPEYELLLDPPGTLAVTLLRSVGRLSGGDLLTRPGGEAGWITEAPGAQCLGEHMFRYAILPHYAAGLAAGDALNQQLEHFHAPPFAVRRGGPPLVELAEFGLELSPAALVFSCFKPAENGKGYVFRCYNPTPEAIDAELRSHCALRHVLPARLDETITGASVLASPDRASFRLEAGKIATFVLEFDEKPRRSTTTKR